MPQTKEHSTYLKQDCQMKITCTYLLPYLADEKNNDQKTTLTNKRSGGGKKL